MALDKNGLKAIGEIVNKRAVQTETYLKDYVEFAIEKTELRADVKFDKLGKEISEVKSDVKEIKRNIDDMIETNQRFIDILGKHEGRIVRVETKLGIKSI